MRSARLFHQTSCCLVWQCNYRGLCVGVPVHVEQGNCHVLPGEELPVIHMYLVTISLGTLPLHFFILHDDVTTTTYYNHHPIFSHPTTLKDDLFLHSHRCPSKPFLHFLAKGACSTTATTATTAVIGEFARRRRPHFVLYPRTFGDSYQWHSFVAFFLQQRTYKITSLATHKIRKPYIHV